ncbi:MAG: hypothetical protein EBU90_01620 [Proteobacteria bacterium]|nr:hypothetical protein [Pseudomonadota bacterium]
MSIQHIESYVKPVMIALLGALYGKISLVQTSVLTTLILNVIGLQADMEQIIHNIVLVSGAATSVTGFLYIVFKFYREVLEHRKSKK